MTYFKKQLLAGGIMVAGVLFFVSFTLPRFTQSDFQLMGPSMPEATKAKPKSLLQPTGVRPEIFRHKDSVIRTNESRPIKKNSMGFGWLLSFLSDIFGAVLTPISGIYSFWLWIRERARRKQKSKEKEWDQIL